MLRNTGTILMLAVMSLTSGCLGHNGPVEPAGERVELDPGEYYGLAWLPSGWFVTMRTREPGQFGSPFTLYRFRRDAEDLEKVQVPEDPSCRRTDLVSPTTLPDGRVGAIRMCHPADGGFVPTSDMVAVDVDDGSIEAIADLRPSAVNGAPFTWNPTLDRGLLVLGSRICDTLVWISRAGMEYPDLEISDGDRAFRLDHLGEDELDCESTGQAGYPAWSPRDDTIAFFASVDAIGLSGPARGDVPHDLYLADVELRHAEAVVEDVMEPRGLTWSPDGSSLVFAGGYSGTTGLWLLRTGETTPELLAATPADRVVWSPDGDELAIAVDVTGGGPDAPRRIEFRILSSEEASR